MIVYRHRRLDTFEIFYVGIGVGRRPYNKTKRSQMWKNIINKTDYQVEIIATDLSNEDAKELEIFLISEYGRRNLGTGKLCNLTDGGDGSVNYIHSQESLEKMSSIAKEQYTNGRVANFKGRTHTDEWKTNFSTNHPKPFLGIKRPEHSKIMSGEDNPNVDILLNLETGIYYYGASEASESTSNLSAYNIRDNISKNKVNRTNFIKTTETKTIE